VSARKSVVLSICLLACTACSSKEKPTPEMIADLKSRELRDRIVAVRNLQHRTGEPEQVVPALIEALKDKSDDVRWSAAIGLGYFGADAKDAIPALEVAKTDPDARVREGARVALSRIDPTKFPRTAGRGS
jgi:HEAT repeat protein